MILKKNGTKVPTKKILHKGEAQVVNLKPGQVSPMEQGGKYLYVHDVGGDLSRVKMEKVEW